MRDVVVGVVRSDAADLTIRQRSILLRVATLPGPHTVRALAASMNVQKPVISRALDRLELLQLCRRVRDPSDGRSVLVVMKDAGARDVAAFRGLIATAKAR